VLDSTSLLTFCGSGDGFVVTWYDQSGNAKNVSSATENQQPQIVSSGAMLVDNGKPYLLYDGNGTTGLFNTSSGLSNTNSSIFATYNSNDSNSGCILSGSGGSGFIGVMTSGSSGAPNNAAGTPKYYKNGSLITNTRGSLFTNYVTNQDVLISILDVDFSNSDWGTIRPYIYTSASFTAVTKVKEYVIYNSDQTSNKAGIEGIIK